VPTLSKRPKSYQRPRQTSYSGTAEKSRQPLLVTHFGPMLTEALVRLASSVTVYSSSHQLKGNGSQTKSAEYENPLNSSCIACESTVGEG
jgi:hypothetical protein